MGMYCKMQYNLTLDVPVLRVLLLVWWVGEFHLRLWVLDTLGSQVVMPCCEGCNYTLHRTSHTCTSL